MRAFALLTAVALALTVACSKDTGTNPPPTAACCQANGSCTLTTQADCAGPNVWHVEWTTCTPDPCPEMPATAACCAPNGTCTVTTQVDCAAPSIWHAEWTACAPRNPCPPRPTGACCALAGTCTVTAQAVCTRPNTWRGAGTSCTPNPCVLPDSNFVLVQAGTFTMGSPTAEPGRFDDETQHEVSLTKSYYVSKYEVTQAEWEAVMHWNDSSFLGPNKPIDRISWYDCISYCNKRSGAEGLDSVYVMRLRYYEGHNITVATPVTCDWAKNGYRLPTDAEWENACRAGSVTAFCNGPILNATFPCGRDRNLDLVGWYCANSSGATHEVGGKAANAWGLFDMHGNIWEYCWDWWCGDCNDAPATDPHGAATGTYRVCRGGNWVSGPFECRSALRSGKVPGEHDGTNMRGGYGLRVVRNPQ